MQSWRIATLLAASIAARGQDGGTVAEIVATVRDAVHSGRSDSAVARSLRRFRLGERLDDRVVEELESAGAGPKTAAELERLRDQSLGLAAPDPEPVFRHGPPPSGVAQRGILAAARGMALDYSKSLPDFICQETIRRYEKSGGSWNLNDTLEIRLTYFKQREDYTLVSRNGRATGLSYREAGGAITEGEFGTTLLSIFAPDSETAFEWDHWTTLRRSETHVFRFRIALDHSTYRIAYGRGPSGPIREIIAGQHGWVYVDAASGHVARVVEDSDSIPPDFPVRSSSRVVDYGFVKIGDRTYLLPLRAEARMGTDSIQTRNVVEFHNYRKFEGQSSITFH
jgi:hypothetical protein